MPENQQGKATIRTADVADGPALAALRWAWRVTELGEHGMVEEGFTEAFSVWFIEHREDHPAFIAELDGRVVGMAWLAIVDRVPGPRTFVRLAGLVQSVYVLAEVRDRGIGRALMEAVIAEGRERGLEFLIVHPSARAFPMYRRLGFAVTDSFLHLRLR